MSDTKRAKREESATDDPEEDQAAVDAATEAAALEDDADADGGEAAEEEYEYEAEDNEFITALADVQDKLMEVNDEASDKVLQVEQEYNLKRQPIYRERNEIIRQMPDFWHEVFRGHETIRPFITAEDEEGLAHLQEVLVEDAPDIKSGFKIVFTFLENRFFQNTQLEKNIRYLEDGSYEITTVGPQWHAGQALTEIPVYEGGKPTGKKRKRATISFFSWLEGDMPQETELEIAEIIKEQIWPNPLAYFQNIAGAHSDEAPIELLEDEEEEEYDEDEPCIFDEHGNPIGDTVIIRDGDLAEHEDLEEYYEEEPDRVNAEGDEGYEDLEEGEEEEAAAEPATGVEAAPSAAAPT